MIDPAVIREKYAQMSDEALLSFAKTEGLKLTSDAFLLLREEFKKRELDAAVMRELEHEIILRHSLNRRQSEMEQLAAFDATVWEYAFEQKMKGVSSYEIHQGIINMGVSSEDAYFVVDNLKKRALVIKAEASLGVSSGYGIIVLGIVASYIFFSIARFELIGIVIVIGGIVRLFTAMMRKEKAMKVIEHLTEKDDREN